MSTWLILHRKACTRPEVEEAVDQVRNAGIDLHVLVPWGGGDLADAVEQAIAGGADRIIAGGGDGTVNAVVNVLLNNSSAAEVSLGVLPLGTANDFARGAGIPVDDPTAALMLACTGQATQIDAGRMNGRYFINAASGGFGAEITAQTPKVLKAVLGGAAYSIMGLIKAFDLEAYEARLILPDGSAEYRPFQLMAVGNARFAGGGFEIAPRASMSDGLLDLAFVSDVVASSLDVMGDTFDESNESLHYRQLASFVVETDHDLHMNLDGEPTKATRFEFDVHPRAISMVLGPAQ